MSKSQYNYKCVFFFFSGREKEIQIQQIALGLSSYLHNMAKNEPQNHFGNFPIFLNLKLSVIKGI